LDAQKLILWWIVTLTFASRRATMKKETGCRSVPDEIGAGMSRICPDRPRAIFEPA
jgi:hypothetical protein